MVDFVSQSIYEQRFEKISNTTKIIKDLTDLILSYDSFLLKSGSLINCIDRCGRFYFSTVLAVTTDSAIVHFHGWNSTHNEEIIFSPHNYRISLFNRNEIIDSHFKFIRCRNVCTKEQVISIVQSLEAEGLHISRILATMFTRQVFTIDSIRALHLRYHF
jgi:hypothetical protein